MRTRAVIVVVTFVTVLGALSGCMSLAPANVTSARAYAGAERPAAEVSVIEYRGTGFPGIYLYRVDGQPMMDPVQADPLVPCTYSEFAMLGFKVMALPGPHVLEFYNVHKTPFDKSPLTYRSLSFATEAGKTYTMAADGTGWKVTCDGAVVPSTLALVPVLDVPAEGQPRAMLVYDQTADAITPYVFRIDGKISPAMNYIEARWVAYNRPGTLPVTLRRDLRAIQMPLVDPSWGKLTIAVAPGHHVIEYATDYAVMAYRCMATCVRRVEFDAVAGKTYRLVVDVNRDPQTFPTGSPVRVVAE